MASPPRNRSGEPPADRAPGGAAALPLALALLAALRAIAPLIPGSYLWGADVGRELPHGAGALAWLVPAAALIPGVGRALARAISAAAGVARRAPRAFALLAALAAALIVGSLEDRTQFLGDFALRTGTITPGADLRQLFPQAMPLDLLLRVRLPTALWQSVHVPAAATQRMLGALSSALLALAALEIARALRASGAAAFAVAAMVWGGGYLALFTGYGKGLAECTVLIALAAAAALSALGDERALPRLALCAALALGFHRAGILLIPLVIVALIVARGGWRDASRWIALGVLTPALALFLPKVAGLLVHFDLPRNFRGASGPPGWLRALDLANAALALIPAVPLLSMLVPALARAPARERWLMIALALPALALFAGVRPSEGVFRYLDVFAPAAIALAIVIAAGAARVLSNTPDRAWLAPALALCVLAPSFAQLAVLHRPALALPRIEAYAEGPPPRPAAERADIWDFLGTRALAERRAADAARCFQQAAGAAASPRLLYEWGSAEYLAGNDARADSLFHESIARDPDFAPAWRGIASTASWRGDTLMCAEAALRLDRLDPQAPELPALREFLARARRP